MNRGGISGIRGILNTGKVFSDSIPIGADTKLVSVMTRIFITGTIAARVQVGIKDSMASVLLEPPGLASAPQEPLVLAFMRPGPLVMAYKLLQPLVVGFLPRKRLMGMLATASDPQEPLVLASVLLEPLVLASVNPEKLLLARKNRSSSFPPGASSQIAQPGRSGIILQAKSRFPLFGHYTRYRKKAATSIPGSSLKNLNLSLSFCHPHGHTRGR